MLMHIDVIFQLLETNPQEGIFVGFFFLEIGIFYCCYLFLLTHYRPALRSATEKFILEDPFSSVLSQFKNITPLETWKLII